MAIVSCQEPSPTKSRRDMLYAYEDRRARKEYESEYETGVVKTEMVHYNANDSNGLSTRVCCEITVSSRVLVRGDPRL